MNPPTKQVNKFSFNAGSINFCYGGGVKKENITSSVAQTKNLAKKFAKNLLAEKIAKASKAVVIGLKGDLGGGKTTFVQGFAKGLGIKEKVLSPTFVIYRKYNILNLKEARPLKSFYHFDCYRIKNPKEIIDLGFKEIISDPKNIVIIEWADKIKKIMPQNTLWLNFEFINESARVIDSFVK